MQVGVWLGKARRGMARLIKCLGIDVGKRNDPASMIGVEGDPLSQRRHIIHCSQIPLGTKYDKQAGIVKKRAWSYDLIVVDGTGVGDAFIDILESLPDVPPVWFVGITSGKNFRMDDARRKCNVPKKSLIEHTIACAEKAALSHAYNLSGIDQLWDELASFERAKDGTMNARSGKHDDRLMALALALFGFIIARMAK